MDKTGCSEGLFDSVSKLAAKGAALLLVFVLSAVSAAAQQKQHQATGTVATSAPTQLVILKKFGRNKARWNFALTPKTKVDGRLLPTVRVRVYYHEDKGQKVADRIKIVGLGASAASKPKVSRVFALRDDKRIC